MQSKADFYDHLESSLLGLVDASTDWVSSLSNAASLIYASMNRFHAWEAKRINWAGFYLLSPLMPSELAARRPRKQPTLLLGPFNGLPACQLIHSVPGRGVCADASALLPPRVVRVDDTEAYPDISLATRSAGPKSSCPSSSPLPPRCTPSTGTRTTITHERRAAQIPDDKSWAGRGNDENVIIGVLDIDCESLNGFDAEDEARLNKIAHLLVERSAW